MEAIGKIIATEKQPSTIEEFTFWTRKDLKLKPFDVVVVEHVKDVNGEPTKTFGVIEEISHMTDSPSALAGYISSDFGQVESTSYTERIGMNYVKCKVVGNTKNIYIPVQEGKKVYLAERDEIMEALGLNNVKHKLPAGYIEMYIIRKSKFPQNPKRSVRFSGKRTKRSVQKRKARNTQKAETKVL